MLENMLRAIGAVNSGSSVCAAARMHGVNESTLRWKIKHPVANPHGGQTLFTKFEEESFVSLCQGFEMMKLPLARKDFLEMAKEEALRKRKNIYHGTNF